MKLELIIFGITTFIIFNLYHDGKYTKILLSYKKYYQMVIIIIIALSLYIMIKKNPTQSKNMLLYTNNMIKYMPIDRNSMSILSPIFDFTSKANNQHGGFMKEVNYGRNINYNSNTNSGFNLLNFNNNNNTSSNDNLSERQNSGLFKNKKSTKRSVSETKKKYIAYLQDWKCGQCGNRLKHTFEVDHKIRLEQGGGNDVSNLVALCRECHGCKTAMENM